MTLFGGRKHVRRILRVLLVTNGLILIAGAMLGPIYALFVEDIGGDLLDASMAGVAYALVAGVVTLISGKWFDRVKRPEFIVATGYAIIAIGFFYYLFVDSILELLIGQVIIGFGEAIYAPAFDALYADNLDKTRKGSEWGLWEAMDYFTAAGGALIGGFLVTAYDFPALFVVMGTISTLSFIYIMILPKKFFT